MRVVAIEDIKVKTLNNRVTFITVIAFDILLSFFCPFGLLKIALCRKVKSESMKDGANYPTANQMIHEGLRSEER